MVGLKRAIIAILLIVILSSLTSKTFAQSQPYSYPEGRTYEEQALYVMTHFLCVLFNCPDQNQNPSIPPGVGIPNPTISLTPPETQPPSNPGAKATSIRSSALALRDEVKNRCAGVANRANNCYGELEKSNLLRSKPPALAEIRASIYDVRGGVLQCVGFVKAASALSDLVWNASARYGEAANYAVERPPNGFVFLPVRGNRPQIGDVMIWGRDPQRRKLPAGHMAVVTEVSDAINVEVTEANWGSPGKVQTRKVMINSPNSPLSQYIVGWYRAL